MTKSHSSPRRHRAAGPPARRVSLRGRYAWSFVIGWATFPFLPAQGNAQGRCDTPSCDCRTGQVTPCDAVGAMGSRAFDSLMLPSLAEATLRNTDRLGNSIESKTLKWIERSKQLSARWRFADSSCDSCDAGGQGGLFPAGAGGLPGGGVAAGTESRQPACRSPSRSCRNGSGRWRGWCTSRRIRPRRRC